MSDRPPPGARPAEDPGEDPSLEVWELRYREALAGLERSRALPQPPPGAERRAHPRLPFPEGAQVFVHDGPKAHSIRDVSAGGLSFYSRTPYIVGNPVQLSAMGSLAVEAEVVGCEMEQVDEELLEYRYRVRCRFAETAIGYQVFVLGREIHQRYESRNA